MLMILKDATERLDHIQFRQVPLETILPLREAVLFIPLGLEVEELGGDRDPLTRHYAAISAGAPLACLSLMRHPWVDAKATESPASPQPAWQLRGMAVASDQQRQGIGMGLLQFVLGQVEAEAAAGTGPPLIWCNAIATATDFYAHAGFRLASEMFEFEGAGPHYKMVRPVA